MKNYTSIDIDIDVFKAIVQHSNYINEPANDVLKRLIVTNNKVLLTQNDKVVQQGGLTTKGVFLKNGLELQRHLKGKLFEAIVRDGYIEFNKKRYTSPSGAAMAAAEGSVNGWRFWTYYDEKKNGWFLLEDLRKK